MILNEMVLRRRHQSEHLKAVTQVTFISTDTGTATLAHAHMLKLTCTHYHTQIQTKFPDCGSQWARAWIL